PGGARRGPREGRRVHPAPHRAQGPGPGLVRRVAIVGCGLVGAKRARALGGSRLVAVADNDRERARILAEQFSGCVAETDWRAAVARPDVEIVIVATTNDSLAPVSLAAVELGKHVLVEKPAARHPSELA